MPFDTRKYTGMDFLWRAMMSSTICMGISTLLTYPLDLIHTRMSVDMSRTGTPRMFTTTFDCFNRTNLDEGKRGLYKGVEICVLTAVVRACLTLPLYDMVRRCGPTEQQWWQKIGAAATSGLLISGMLYPLDTIKRCMQLNGSRGQLNLYSTTQEGIMTLPGKLGVNGLYRGVGVFCLAQTLKAYGQMTIYDFITDSKY